MMKKFREAELEIEVSICEREKGEFLGENEDGRSVKDLEHSRQQEVYFAEEGIIDDFLNCWENSDQQEDVKPCIFESDNFDMITGFVEEEKSFEAIKSMAKYIFEDKNFEVKNDGECPLNEKSSELLQQKEFINTLIFEVVTTHEKFLVKKGHEIQSEELICEATIETVETCNFQTNNLCINVGTVSSDEVLMKCNREI